MAFVITITGASGCGKSTIIDLLKKIGEKPEYKEKFQPIVIKKYTTRSFRINEIEALKNKKYELLDVKAVCGEDNILYDSEKIRLSEKEENIRRRQAFKKLKCDLVYEQYGNQYGIHIKEIYEALKVGKSPIIILNDVRTVEDLKVFLGNKCISLFVFRKAPDIVEFMEMGEKRKANNIETENRYKKATAIHRIYIENIHLFDKLILNVKEGEESLLKILEQLVSSFCREYSIFKY